MELGLVEWSDGKKNDVKGFSISVVVKILLIFFRGLNMMYVFFLKK
jgi:hypothetical protein